MRNICRATGFTLVELVIVLTLLATLAIYATVRWSPEAGKVGLQADLLAAKIRHLQALAMGRGESLTLDILADRYHVRDSDGAIITDPATNSPFTVVLESNTNLTGADTAFDSLGRPTDAGVLLTANRTLTITAGGNTSTVTVAPVTGFVTIAP